MPTLFELDARIHTLTKDIERHHRGLVTTFDLAAKWQDLADAYVTRSSFTRSVDDLIQAKSSYEQAISLGQDAVQHAANYDAQSKCWFFQAGRLRAYWEVFRGRPEIAPRVHGVLDQAIDAYGFALSLLAPGETMRVESAHNRGNLLAERFDQNLRDADLEEAIYNGYEALTSCSPESIYHGTILNDIAQLYLARWGLYHQHGDLIRATELAHKSVHDPHCNVEQRIKRTFNLCNSRRYLYENLGDVKQLERGQRELVEALPTCEASAPRLVPHVLARLAIVTQQLSVARNDPRMQAEAVQLTERALRMAQADQIEDGKRELMYLVAEALWEVEGGTRAVETIVAEIASGRNPLGQN